MICSPMPIQDNPELNRMINKRQKDTNYGGSLKYCLYCGAPLIFTKNDTYGNENPNRFREWEEEICHKCWPKHIRRKRQQEVNG